MGFKDFFKKEKRVRLPFDGEEGRDGIGPAAVDNKSGIASFYYSYNGSIGGDSYHCRVRRKDSAWLFSYETMLKSEYGELETEIDGSAAERLYALYLSNRIAEWEGFSKYNTMILDGSGFSLEIVFNDGRHMSASGSNAFPPGYRDFVDAMDEIMRPLSDKVLEEARQARIRRGLSGSLGSAIIFFKQRGASGSDEYKFILSKKGIRDKNFDVDVRSESGEFFPRGSHRMLLEVPDGYTALDGIEALVRKYDVIEWCDFDKSDPDRDNKEWFQLSLSFDGDPGINAMDTAHPPRYDGFRKDLLTLMASAVKKVQDEIIASREAGKDER